MNPYFLIFGFGYTAKALAPKLHAHDFKLIASSRNPEKNATKLCDELIDFNSPQLKQHLNQATHILISIPPTQDKEDLVLKHYGELIKKQAAHIQWLGYLSSTGVYGDHQGQWVDESTLCQPHTATGVARLQVEQAWLSFAKKNQLALHIFRLAGIYGPGRNALERIKAGKKFSLFKENQVFCRMHVDDIATTLLASIMAPNPLSIYNLSDDEPAPAHEVDQYAASLLNQAPPPLVLYSEAKLSPMEAEFYSSNRRVANLKIKDELKVKFAYPNYKLGLKNIFNEEGI